ncbi:MAG: beta-ketoacyl-ACP synthase II [Actinomycetota bacterium]
MRRVVVTGMGTVNPIGNSIPELDRALREGRSGGAVIASFDVTDSPVKIGCEVKGFDPESVLDRKSARRTSRFIHLAVGAAHEAVESSGLDIRAEGDRVGASIASGIGGMDMQLLAHEHYLTQGIDRFSPFWTPGIIPNMGAGYVSMEFGTRGPLASSSTACAASSMAIGDAVMYIRAGMADAMLAGGAECGVVPVGIGGFHGIRACSTRNDEPATASRPFDATRDGIVLGEAGSVLVLEELEHALRRDATILAEVTGYGLSSDARHVTEPDPTGENPARAITNALADAGRMPADVEYVNAHGTSTPVGDAAETRVLKKVFGDRAKEVPVSSTKSMTGHLLGATGATEAAICVLAINGGYLPPTINLHTPDPECDLDYVPNTAREQRIDVAISNGFGFGGHNACLVIERFEERRG